MANARNSRRTRAETSETETLGESAYQRLRMDIVAGQFEAGQPLRLEALRQRYGLSFSPLREALTRLQAERLVQSTALRGFSVAPLSRAEMIDATETKILIECEALRRSMLRGDDDWEASVVAAFHAFRLQTERLAGHPETLAPLDLSAMEKRHYDFHRALIGHCDSPRLLEISDRLYIETQRYRLPSLTGIAVGGPSRDVSREHEEIMNTALERSETACALLAAHYRRSAEIISASANWV